jgi:transcriptional regulator with XRE-family HTH domain
MAHKSASVFGQIVRERRVEAGLSQEALADQAGLHRTFISMIERGTRNPSLEVIRKLARGLRTTAASLVEETERKDPS